jgi:hypothetical protein
VSLAKRVERASSFLQPFRGPFSPPLSGSDMEKIYRDSETGWEDGPQEEESDRDEGMRRGGDRGIES